MKSASCESISGQSIQLSALRCTQWWSFKLVDDLRLYSASKLLLKVRFKHILLPSLGSAFFLQMEFHDCVVQAAHHVLRHGQIIFNFLLASIFLLFIWVDNGLGALEQAGMMYHHMALSVSQLSPESIFEWCEPWFYNSLLFITVVLVMFFMICCMFKYTGLKPVIDYSNQ